MPTDVYFLECYRSYTPEEKTSPCGEIPSERPVWRSSWHCRLYPLAAYRMGYEQEEPPERSHMIADTMGIEAGSRDPLEAWNDPSPVICCPPVILASENFKQCFDLGIEPVVLGHTVSQTPLDGTTGAQITPSKMIS
jgi:hypothetical protein